ncbi:hypothetical protein, partial [Staphylococcus haemolyticus]|uniref:hypothetical protein n=1 Tax=Staphylococcus haemolyticus TaxID=1283 RepID=UPI0015D818D6
MPGLANCAPERTATRSGSSGWPRRLPPVEDGEHGHRVALGELDPALLAPLVRSDIEFLFFNAPFELNMLRGAGLPQPQRFQDVALKVRVLEGGLSAGQDWTTAIAPSWKKNPPPPK